MRAQLNSEDFLAGLLAALAKRDWAVLSIRGDRFDRASQAAFQRLETLARERGIRLRFYVKPHPSYRDSTVMRDAIARLAMWDLVSLDNPEYQDVRLKISPEFADAIFRRLKVDPAVFDKVADSFTEVYEPSAGGTRSA